MRDLFARIAIKLLAASNDDALNGVIAREIGFPPLSEGTSRIKGTDWETVKAQFLSLGYVTITYGMSVSKIPILIWQLTDYGTRVGLLLRSVKRGAVEPAQL